MVQYFLTFNNTKFFIFCRVGEEGRNIFWNRHSCDLAFSLCHSLYCFCSSKLKWEKLLRLGSQCRCLGLSWLAVDLCDSLWSPSAASGAQGEIWSPESGLCLCWGLSVLLPKGHRCYWSAPDGLWRRAQVISLCYKQLDLAFQVAFWDSGLFGDCPEWTWIPFLHECQWNLWVKSQLSLQFSMICYYFSEGVISFHGLCCTSWQLCAGHYLGQK